jgi:ribonuclease P protein component
MQTHPGPAQESREPSHVDPAVTGHATGMQNTDRSKPDQGLSREQRLTRSSLFRETYEQGRRWTGRYMVLWLRSGEGAALRLGVVSSRKVGGAVARVRARRLLREAYRRIRYRFSGPYDVILVSRRSLLEARWEDINRELLDLAQKAGLLKGNEGTETP